MPKNKQSVKQTAGTNTGQMQAIASVGNVTITQQGEASEQITPQQVAELLTQIESLIKASQLPSEVVEEASKYVGKAKEETQEKQPKTAIVLSHLDRATTVIKKLDTASGAVSDLVGKLTPLFD